MTTRLSQYVSGGFVDSRSDDMIPSINPSRRDDVVAEVPVGSPEDVSAACASARQALEGWRRRTGAERAAALQKWSDVIDNRAEDFVRAIVREVGKPIVEARGEVARAVVILRYYAGEAVREVGEVIPAGFRDTLQFTVRQPLGVVGLITPWNFPIAIPLWKAAPAMAFGNTVVLKPSEHSAHVAQMLAESASIAGVPEGAFNVVHGVGPVAGEALVGNEIVRGVSFTGSTRAGARVAEIASSRNIPYQTEMGGKNVVIVLEDADLDRAAALTTAGAMRFGGQKCTATSRAVVAASVHDAFIEKLVAACGSMTLGPVTDTEALVGPLITETARDRVLGAIAATSGRIACGGSVAEDGELRHGWFVTPTVVADVPHDSEIARQELFGPVLATFPVDDLDDAFAVANDTPYGLSASIFTRDIGAALRYVDEIEVGLVRVNGDTTGVDPHAPFGGMKGSSSGTREQGRVARDFYTEIKTVQMGA